MTCVLLRCSCPDHDTAHGIAHALMEARAAACVHLLPPVHSVYRWKGHVQEGHEVVLEAKTTPEAAERAMATISALHPYTCPVIEQSTVAINSAAAQWLREQLA